MKETQIVKAILDYLKWTKILAWRSNNIGTYSKAREQYIFHGLKGVSDILGVLDGGKFLAIEVKTDKGKLSEYQKEFLDKVNKLGGKGFVARSIEDVVKELTFNKEEK